MTKVTVTCADEQETTRFGNLGRGDFFESDGKLFMKLDPAGSACNVFCFSTESLGTVGHSNYAVKRVASVEIQYKLEK